MSNPLEVVPELGDVAGALYKATGNGSVPRTTINLTHLRASQIVGNTYLTVRSATELRKAGESEEPWSGAPRPPRGSSPAGRGAA
jgi:hypothetical protein